MKKYFTPLLLILILLVWVATQRPFEEKAAGEDVADSRARPTKISTDGETSDGGRLKLRVRDRNDVADLSTHRPDQLVSFLVGEVEIQGLTLNAALEKLMSAYREACVVSDEVPIELVFIIPPDSRQKLWWKTSVVSVHSAVRALGALAGMEVTRSGKTYTFKRDETRENRTVEIGDAHRFRASLREWSGQEESDNVATLLSGLGVDLDPQTRVSLTPDGKISISTPSVGDLKAISTLASVSGRGGISQTHFFKAITISADCDVELPSGPVSDRDVQLLLRSLAQKRGTDLMTMPSVASRPGQPSKVEIVREISSPGMEPVRVGHVLEMEARPLAFGTSAVVKYSDTDARVDPQNGIVVDTNVEIGGEGYSRSGETQIFVETKPDGSRRLLMVTGNLVDSTGRPLPGN